MKEPRKASCKDTGLEEPLKASCKETKLEEPTEGILQKKQHERSLLKASCKTTTQRLHDSARVNFFGRAEWVRSRHGAGRRFRGRNGGKLIEVGSEGGCSAREASSGTVTRSRKVGNRCCCKAWSKRCRVCFSNTCKRCSSVRKLSGGPPCSKSRGGGRNRIKSSSWRSRLRRTYTLIQYSSWQEYALGFDAGCGTGANKSQTADKVCAHALFTYGSLSVEAGGAVVDVVKMKHHYDNEVERHATVAPPKWSYEVISRENECKMQRCSETSSQREQESQK